MSDVFVGRQAIFKPQLDLFAYELLFRGDDLAPTAAPDGDEATARVTLNTFVEIGLERVAGEVPALINVTRNLLLSGFCFSLPSDRVVLEVLEDIELEQAVLRALSDLSASGYLIALDDFVYRSDLVPLAEIADFYQGGGIRYTPERSGFSRSAIAAI